MTSDVDGTPAQRAPPRHTQESKRLETPPGLASGRQGVAGTTVPRTREFCPVHRRRGGAATQPRGRRNTVHSAPRDEKPACGGPSSPGLSWVGCFLPAAGELQSATEPAGLPGEADPQTRGQPAPDGTSGTPEAADTDTETRPGRLFSDKRMLCVCRVCCGKTCVTKLATGGFRRRH